MLELQKIQNKIVEKKEAVSIVNKWKEMGNTIVFTNGCFDIVHKGHIFYLAKAKELGQKLVVGLNSDESVKRLKGETRPIKEQESREYTLAAFSFIDLVVPFNEDTPLDLITNLLPTVLVKGKDYLEDDIVGAKIVKENGGSVKTIDLEDGFSTSNYANKI